MSTYQRLPISFNKGEGVWLHAKNGDKYLDALSGIAVNTLGYSHPKFVKAISKQIKNLIHILFYLPTIFPIGQSKKLFVYRSIN